MPKYRIEVPVVVFCYYTVEAENAEAALDVPVVLSRKFYETPGGIATQRGCSISSVNNDNADWEKATVTPE